jgi:hypothetical protein
VRYKKQPLHSVFPCYGLGGGRLKDFDPVHRLYAEDFNVQPMKAMARPLLLNKESRGKYPIHLAM